MTQAAVFEAVNAITGRYGESRLHLGPAPDASGDAAVTAATCTTLLALLPGEKGAVEAWARAALARVPEGKSRDAGTALGEKAALGILALRAEDGASAPDTYRPRTTPGVYVPTVTPAVAQWPGRKPWFLASAAQFRPGPPPALTSAAWAADYNETKALGGRGSTLRTPAQTAIAKFWEDNSAGIYYGVLRSFAESAGRDLTDNARLYSIAATAMDDAQIAVADAKYAYFFWRPVTAIRNGDQDGNDATEREAGWSSFIETPIHPEYPCAHCIQASALAEVLRAAMPGNRPVALSTTSLTAPGVTRAWTSLAAFVEEVSNARVWSGVHFRTSTRAGEAMGREVGQLAARQLADLPAKSSPPK
jgi:hypothetical protein